MYSYTTKPSSFILYIMESMIFFTTSRIKVYSKSTTLNLKRCINEEFYYNHEFILE